MKIAIVGAGLTGSVIAERYAKHGHNVVIFEKREHIGGNCYSVVLDIVFDNEGFSHK
jgi:UDP-galactopyranose mutase